jgi:hypothetical protein
VPEITVIELGVPGPSGAGITAAQWAALQAIVASASTGLVNVSADSSVAILVETAAGLNVVQVDTQNKALRLHSGADLRLYVTDDATTERVRIRGDSGHFKSSGTSPTIANGAAAGTSPSAPVILGTDRCGIITIGTGTATATGTLCTVTFAIPYDSNDYVVMLSPAEADAAATGSTRVRADTGGRSTTQFTLDVTGSALSVSTQYVWFYLIEEYQP